MARREEKNTTQRRPEDWFPSVRAPGTASTDDLSGKVDTTTEVIAGAGLTDGGDLSANVTLNVGAGTGITVNANDVAIDTTAEAERIRDTIGTALVAGSNVTITVSDPGDTITIESSGTSYTDEQAQDAVGTILTDTATIDFTYNDASNQITADVKTGSIGPTQLADTTVVPGSYTIADITVDADGRITAASNNASSAVGCLIGRQIITTTGAGTYTPTTGTHSIIIEMVGGGGGGAGCASPGANNGTRSGSGGGGAYLRKRLTGNFSGASYVVGAKGSGGAAGANNGNDGINTTFTDTAGSPTTYTAGKGFGGTLLTAGSTVSMAPTAAGGTATNGDLNIPGGASQPGLLLGSVTGAGWSGNGGISQFSSGGGAVVNNVSNTSTAGINAGGFGGGGSAAFAQGTAVAKAGGDGSNGILIIWEYS